MSFRLPIHAALSLVLLLLLSPHAAEAQTTRIWDAYPPLPGSPPPTDTTAADPPRAPEPPSAPFGARGVVVLGGSTDVGVSSTTYDSTPATSFSAKFAPSLDYFVLKNFLIGLSLGVHYSDNRGYGTGTSLVETKTTSFAAGPRFGLNVPFGKYVSWWLTGSLGIESIRTDQTLPDGGTITVSSSTGAPSTSKNGPWVSAYLPLLVHPAPHFFLGAGPSIFHEFASLQGGPNVGDQATTVGAAVLVGGYWGGTPEGPAPAAPDAPSAPVATFGERGELALSSELVASLYSTQYAGTGSSQLQGALVLGADYFFIDHVSLGFAFNASLYDSTGVDGSGNAMTDDTTSFGLAIRLGGQLPLAGPVSLYPRVGIGFEGGTYDERSVAGQNTASLTEVGVTADAPLLVEVAPHFFVGLGPSLHRDLSRSYAFPQGEQVSNTSTTVGAGFTVGGWL